jgi:hypothetical protein
MRLMTHVRRSSDGFEVRIVVPTELRSTIGKANLTGRLGRLSKSEANRLAAPMIERFVAQIEGARLGAFDETPRPTAVTTASAIRPGRTSPSSSPRLMALFDGYVRERQPSPATIKRWHPIINQLVKHLRHDEPRRITTDDIIGWKESLARHGVSGRRLRANAGVL